jgi:hypothetical protein
VHNCGIGRLNLASRESVKLTEFVFEEAGQFALVVDVIQTPVPAVCFRNLPRDEREKCFFLTSLYKHPATDQPT